MASLIERIRALEALRRERTAMLLRSLDPVVQAARWTHLVDRCRLSVDGSFPLTAASYRAKRCAELLGIAQQRAAAATFSDLA